MEGISSLPARSHTYTYGNTVWRDLLTAYDGQSITYDQIGNPLIYRNGIRFAWVHGRQMSSVLSNGVPTYYTYNADGTRHSKSTQTNVTKTTTYYYVEGVLYAVESPDYTVVFQMDDTGRPYGFRLLRNDSPGYESQLYYKYNLQGDVVGIYDFTGNEVVTYTYDPWGKLLSATGVDVLIDANPLLYRGYVYDTETGFYYCNSRYYDPETGRWINADNQIAGVGGEILGYNMFAYCFNNPINMSDSTGNWPSWNDVVQGAKKGWDALVSVAEVGWNYVKACANSFEIEMGFGAGVKGDIAGASAEVSLGAKGDFVNVSYSHKDKWQACSTLDAEIIVQAGPIRLGAQAVETHPLICTCKDSRECENHIVKQGLVGELDPSIDLIALEGYILYGITFRLSFNMQTFLEEVMVLYE